MLAGERMEAITFKVRFDGLDSSSHHMEARLLGTALQGLDTLVGDAVFGAVAGRPPTTAERREIVVWVAAPQVGCVEIPGQVGAASGLLPFILDALKHPGTKFLYEILSFLLKLKGGKPKDAQDHAMEAYRLLVEDRVHERQTHLQTQENWMAFCRDLAGVSEQPLRKLAAPVGRAAETLTLDAPAGRPPTVIDVPMAEAIRSNEPLEVGDMQRMRLRVDGVIKHTRKLKVETEDRPGEFINAEVRDPAFDSRPNVYTRALEGDGYLDVDAKPTYRNGELVKLHIMDAREA